MVGATVAVVLGTRALTGDTGAELTRLVDLVGAAVIVLVLGPGRARVQAAVERLVFRRGRLRQATLQTFLHTLSPELGIPESCRRALVELCRVMGLRGAAILLLDGGTVVEGAISVAPLERVWPRGADAEPLPERAFREAELRSLPAELREALIEAGIAWVTPITSPRRPWGHLFVAEGLLTTPSSDEDLEEVTGFVDQLALVLDGAELLARTRAVERSLAHAEKLAAIGELAARVAHDIRNPVTAARSLAQQLIAEPGSPFREEHEVILAELERIERQVADLLRFARRDEFRFEPVDLGGLVRTTVDQLRPRLEAAGIAVEVATDDGLTARPSTRSLRAPGLGGSRSPSPARTASPRCA
jgi:signal transduction histidine kinase